MVAVLVCQLIFQPVITLIQFVVSVIEFVLVRICQIIQTVVSVITSVLTNVCNTVTQTVCGAVCGVICGICDFFCGIFGCSCGCKNVCNNVCNFVTSVVCSLVYVLVAVLKAIATLVCKYLLQAIIKLLNIIEAIVTMVLTWICTIIDLFIRWLVCWTYIAEIFNSRRARRFKVAPKIVRNSSGHSEWFVYVDNVNADGTVQQSAPRYILSDKGRPLVPIADDESGSISYFEVGTRGGVITGQLRRGEGRRPIPGQPLLYYPYKVLEIASHLFGDIFAAGPGDDGRGTDFANNLLTYTPNVQAWLDSEGQLAGNHYNAWAAKYTNPADSNHFGDGTISDMGVRVDNDATCSRPTNTFLHLIHDDIGFTPPNSDVAETMKCGAGQTLTFEETNFLLLNKDSDGSAVTTYLVSKYDSDESSVGCDDLLGYTTVTFESSGSPIFIASKVLQFEPDTNLMMKRIVENIASTGPAIVRVAETYLHECGHQCGLLHDSDAPDCQDDTTLDISKIMAPGASVRRALTRLQWCLMWTTTYVTSRDVKPFVQAPELPDSGSAPAPPPK